MYTKQELQVLSKTYFESHPTAEVFHATSDGNFFLDEQKNEAHSHAKHIGGALHTIVRDADEVDQVVEVEQVVELDLLEEIVKEEEEEEEAKEIVLPPIPAKGKSKK